MEAGKQVGFSFGYDVQSFEYIQPRDYESRLAQYVKPERLAANIAMAKRFSQIRILKKVNIIEDSIVTRPMNRLAGATGVKGSRPLSTAFESARIRTEFLMLRNRAIRTLHGLDGGREHEHIEALRLRAKSMEMRARAERRLYESDVDQCFRESRAIQGNSRAKEALQLRLNSLVMRTRAAKVLA
jgi:hypothetical protein